MIVEGEHSRI